MKKYYLPTILFSLILLSFNTAKVCSTEQAKFLIANIEYSKSIQFLSPFKFEAAFDIACKLSEKYELISSKKRDSVSLLFEESGKHNSALDVAIELKANHIVFANVNVIGNMLRVDLTVINSDADHKKRKSFGYAAISKRNLEDNSMIYDPAILAATQRALAVVMKDSMMFDKLSGSAQVYPAETLVISGLFYINDKNNKEWDLFKNKELSSYDACETIFKQAFNTPQYVIYDIETRDSIYSMFGLETPENFNAVSAFELRALSHFEIDKFISGVFKTVDDGVEIELILSDLSKGMLTQKASVKGFLKEDSIIEYRNILQKLTSQLMSVK